MTLNTGIVASKWIAPALTTLASEIAPLLQLHPHKAIASALTPLTSTTVGLFNVKFGDDSIVLDVKGAECCVTSNGTGCN
jgi:hypothetical protein